MATTVERSRGSNARAHVQRFGTFLSGMIMPNIGAFIAWGLITAFFIEKGFTPVPQLGGFGTHTVNGAEVPWTGLVSPMITYLLPLLIAYTGGRMIYDVRGGVVGAIATMGVIVGTNIPMFIGAMIMGPLTAWLMKKIDSIWDGKIKPGFEMLVNNFSAGILGAIMALIAFLVVGPVVEFLSGIAANVVQFLVNAQILPLTSILIEPAKVLFLNNAINHGILTPLGTEQSVQAGKSILFLLEANPGPGLGLLLAYVFFGRGAAKASAGGAALIQFVGGIHEIYFPYVLMKPVLIVATICGGATGILTNVIFNSGLRAPAAPGSIIAVWLQTPPDSFIGVTLSVILAATVSFLIASVILRTSKDKGEGDLSAATSQMEGMKGKKSSVASTLTGGGVATAQGTINTIVFACDAGMGSSAMGASVLRNKIKAAGFSDVKVTNASIASLTDTYDLVVVHQDLAARAEPKTPSAQHVTVDNFMGSPRYDEIVELLEQTNREGGAASAEAAGEAPSAGAGTTGAGTAATGAAAGAGTWVAPDDAPHTAAGNGDGILAERSIVLDGSASSQAAAIEESGKLLVDSGAVTGDYVAAMHERERSVPTYMGNFLAIPHGTNEAKDFISRSAISFVRYPEGIDWNGKPVKFVVGIAGRNNEHLNILSSIAKVFSDQEQVARLEQARSARDVLDIFDRVNNA
ncbi:PTS mannose transporter subunit IIA [Tersicoccus phoenicis]|uniref:Mannitol-specific phosphotransferase enzyme IIA component n=1 Tax=Tersicoccus phoenicis TaxID=554083 RepID=A0A1R1LPA1_9MICC|nr:PTS mannitol transporter subunit IICBA [Tersicoccus phoenicis]OMH29332.1 PTS mannose transporter subunit IIA [Tersicoccus phoenicis]